MLVIEDGTGIANADSFITAADAQTFATNYGITLPSDPTELDVALRQGYLNLLTNEPQLQGARTTDTQNNIFPRSSVYNNCKLVPSDEIPVSVQHAQVYAASAIAGGYGQNEVDTGQNLKSFSVKNGLYQESYQDGSSTSTNARIQGVYNSLYPLTKAGFAASPCGGGSGGLNRDDYFYDGRGLC
jgi:hypothetical protein